MNGKKVLQILLIQVAAVAALVVGYLAWDADAIYELLSGDVVFGTPMSSSCNLHLESCAAVMGDGSPVTLSISPHPIPVMQKLTLQVDSRGLDHKELLLEIYGLNMNMGRHSYRLKQTGDGHYEGEGMIPSCIAGMNWRANLIAESPTKRVGTYFTFSIE